MLVLSHSLNCQLLSVTVLAKKVCFKATLMHLQCLKLNFVPIINLVIKNHVILAAEIGIPDWYYDAKNSIYKLHIALLAYVHLQCVQYIFCIAMFTTTTTALLLTIKICTCYHSC